MDQCKENCHQCFEVCSLTLNYCVAKGGNHVDPAHVSLLMDCIEICRVSEVFLMNGSKYHVLTCGACTRICDDCATSCLSFDDPDGVMAECAAVCTKCAESCAEMSNAI